MDKKDEDEDDSTLRKGNRWRVKNPRYFNKEMVNAIVSHKHAKMKKQLDAKNLKKEVKKMWWPQLWNIF